MTSDDTPRSGGAPSDFTEYARILLARRRILIWLVGVACTITVALSLISPETYSAETSLLPEESRASSISSMIKDAASLDLIAGVGRREGSVFVEMLASRSVLEGVIRKCDLIREFHFDKLPPDQGMEQTVRALRKKTKIGKTEGGIIQVDVDVATSFLPNWKQRRHAADLAAAVANAYADELNEVNQDKATSRARAVRIYLEEQIHTTETKLKAESDSLVQMQLRNRTVALEEQTKAAIETAGELKGKIIAGEMELAILKRTMLPENPEIHAAESKLAELRNQYAKIQYGDRDGSGAIKAGPDSRDFQVPFSDLPEIAQQQASLMRDIAVLQTVYELLNSQYFKAKIQETGDVPALSILDRASPPVYRSWPKRGMLVVSTFAVSLMVAVILALVIEYSERRRGLPIRQGPSGLRDAWRIDRAALRGVFARSPHPR
jgi:uncharacterized protein involved in exopolysaccharide biosynthesis